MTRIKIYDTDTGALICWLDMKPSLVESYIRGLSSKLKVEVVEQ